MIIDEHNYRHDGYLGNSKYITNDDNAKELIKELDEIYGFYDGSWIKQYEVNKEYQDIINDVIEKYSSSPKERKRIY